MLGQQQSSGTRPLSFRTVACLKTSPTLSNSARWSTAEASTKHRVSLNMVPMLPSEENLHSCALLRPATSGRGWATLDSPRCLTHSFESWDAKDTGRRTLGIQRIVSFASLVNPDPQLGVTLRSRVKLQSREASGSGYDPGGSQIEPTLRVAQALTN